MIENYFWEKGAEKFLIFERNLTFNQRANIVNTIVDFLIESYGTDSTSVQKAVVAVAAVNLFPGLEFQDGESTVSIESFSYSLLILTFHSN